MRGELPWRRALAGTLLAAAAASAWGSGAQNYMLYCMGCHGVSAEGVPGKVPGLAHSLGHYMRLPAGRDFVLRVPGAANSVLTDAELCEVLNWLAASYSAQESAGLAPFTVEEVSSRRHQPLVAVLARRREVIQALQAAGVPAVQDY